MTCKRFEVADEAPAKPNLAQTDVDPGSRLTVAQPREPRIVLVRLSDLHSLSVSHGIHPSLGRGDGYSQPLPVSLLTRDAGFALVQRFISDYENKTDARNRFTAEKTDWQQIQLSLLDDISVHFDFWVTASYFREGGRHFSGTRHLSLRTISANTVTSRSLIRTSSGCLGREIPHV
jgi:hypothetical protein